MSQRQEEQWKKIKEPLAQLAHHDPRERIMGANILRTMKLEISLPALKKADRIEKHPGAKSAIRLAILALAKNATQTPKNRLSD